MFAKKFILYLTCCIYVLIQPLHAFKCREQLPNQVKISVVYIPQQDNKSCATKSLAMAISHFEGMDSPPLDKDMVWKLSGTHEDTVRKQGNDMAGLKRVTKRYGYKSEYILTILPFMIWSAFYPKALLF